MGIMEQKMETTIMSYRGLIGDLLRVYTSCVALALHVALDGYHLNIIGLVYCRHPAAK